MRRAIVGKLVGVRPVMLLVLALVAFLGAGPALAQDLVFKSIQIDYFKDGASTRLMANNAVLSVSGILCASDVDKDIFRKDGKNDKWDYSPDGRLNTQRGYSRLLKTTMDRPVLANIEKNDQLYLATIVEGVTPSIVSALRTGNADAANAAMAEVISLVTADFSAGLFAANTNRSVYSDVHPSFATSVVAIKSVLKGNLSTDSGRTAADKDDATFGSTKAAAAITESTSVIVYWDISSLTVSATDSIQAKQNFSATMAINGGGGTSAEKYKRNGVSNFIGIETGINSAPVFLNNWVKANESSWTLTEGGSGVDLLDNANQRGMRPGVNLGIQISDADDTTTNALYGGSGEIDKEPRTWLGEMTFGGNNQWLPFQFRTKDKLRVQVELNTRADLDGEPDAYFGTAGDALTFNNDGTGKDHFIGGKLVVDGWKTNDNAAVFNSSRTYNAPVAAGNGDDTQGGLVVQTPQEVVSVDLSIADTVITSGTYRVFKVKAAIQDEVGGATQVFTNHAIDTAAPRYTAVRASAERGTSMLANGDVGTTKIGNADYDEAIFGIEIDGNGESSADANIKKWLDIDFRDTGRSLAWTKDNSVAGAPGQERRFSDFSVVTNGTGQVGSLAFINYQDASIVNNSHNTLKVDIGGTLISGIPSEAGQILGASVVIRVRNNVTTTINSGGLLVRAIDDARNPAMVYPGSVSNAPVAELNTITTNYSVSSLSPLVANSVSKATVEIDNQPPEINSTQVSILGLPSGYSNGGVNTTDAFNLLKGAAESEANVLVGSKLVGADDAKVVKRGAPASASQNGSPLRLVVKFNPVKDTNLAGEDMDGRPWHGASPAENIAEFNKRFKFNIANLVMGYASDGYGVNYLDGDVDKKARWVIQDATISSTYASGDYSTAVVTAVYVDATGIPKGPGTGLAAATLALQPGDSVVNFDAASNSDTFILDETKPTIAAYDMDTANALPQPVVDSHAAPAGGFLSNAETGLYLTTYGTSVAIPSSAWGNAITTFDITVGGTADRFYNSRDIAGATWPGVKAGDSIIIAGQFTEANAGGVDDADAPFNQVGTADSGFPFIWNSTPADAYAIDTAKTLFGKEFKTISANFGDFIDEDSERDVLPDVIDVYTGAALPANIDADEVDIEPGKTIVAKWFYYLDGGKSLNLSLGRKDVRYVTLTARDLSGNVARKQIAVGTATFSQPQVTILDYEIDTPMLGIRRAVIQRDSSYLGGAGVSAVALSQATVTVLKDANDKIQSSTLMVVAKIGDGVAKGGPYQSGTSFLQADFSMLGGGLENADQITYANGSPVTDGAAISSSDIIYATWWSDRFISDPAKDSGGLANKKIVIAATASTLGVGEAEGTAVQLDSVIPALAVSDIMERRAVDSVATAPSGDQSNDGIVRPNQIVSYKASYEMGTFDKLYSNLIKFAADLKEFGNPVPNTYFWSGHKDYTDASGNGGPDQLITGNEKTAANKVIRGVTIQFTVPSSLKSGFYKAITYATDASGNFNSSGAETNLVTVNSTRPTIESIVMSATSAVNYATDVPGVVNAWRNIGTRTITDPSKITAKEDKGKPGRHAGNSIVKKGDWIRIVAQLNTNDDVFTDLDVTADFSNFSGDAYSAVAPAPYTGIKDKLKNGSANPLIEQGTSVSGTVYSATWIHQIQAADKNITNASVRIRALNPAGVSAENNLMVYSAPIVVDNKAPEVTSQVAFYKKGAKLADDVDEINPNTHLWKAGKWSNVGYATAALIVSATYTDSDVNHGNAASLFSALVFSGGYTGNPQADAVSDIADIYGSILKLDTGGSTKIGTPKPAYFALSDQSGVWNDAGSSTDGPVITSASAVKTEADSKHGSVGSLLRNATATVVNIWYGQHPNGGQYAPDAADYPVTFKNDVDYGNTDRKLSTGVWDNVGNKGTPSVTGVEIDGMMPFIQRGPVYRINKDAKTETEGYYNTLGWVDGANNWYGKKTIKGATLDVAPGEPMFKDNGKANYLPAQWAANGNMLRPTRVTKGTKVRLQTFVTDMPDKSDPITFVLSGKPFNTKASSFEIVKPIAADRSDVDISGLNTKKVANRDFIWQSVFDPTKFSDKAVEVIVDMPVNLDMSKKGNSTIQLDGNLNAPDYDAYRNKVKAKILDVPAGSPIMSATDTAGNWRKDIVATVGLEVDTQGPELVSHYVSFAKDKALADVISLGAIKNIGINANAGSWLCVGATFVVDGTNDLDFPLEDFNVNWAEVFEFDIDRLEHDKNYKGKKYIFSATSAPSIVYATNIIKIKDNADPRNADAVTFTSKDIFGNESSTTTNQLLAIGARGPVATEISLKVDGKSQSNPEINSGGLGIGNQGPDTSDDSSASFEMYPGAKVIVEATVTTIDGAAPDTILLDASDLYPRGLRPMVDELIPTEQRLTDDGIIYCRWETVAFDLEALKQRNAPYVDPNPPAQWKGEQLPLFFDQSNLNWILEGVDYAVRNGSLGANNVPGTPYNGPIKGATPVLMLNQNSIAFGGSNVPTLFGGPKVTHNAGNKVADMPTVLENVEGLPSLQVQKNAAAKRVASITVFVADGGSQFPFEESLSARFAVDTEPPRASYVFSVTKNPEIAITEKFVSGWRIGQPTAPNAAKDNLLDPAPRVRQKDSVAIIVDITNSTINGTGNDAFRELPGLLPSDLTTGFFAIKADDASTVKDVTVDLSGFSSVEGADNMSVRDPNAPVADPDYPNTVSIIDQGTNKPSVIQAKFSVKVTADRGKSMLSSNDPVEVTPTMVDDAGNRPMDTAYDKGIVLNNEDYVKGAANNWVKRQAEQGRQPVLAVDNLGPSINGSVVAQIISGTASIYNTITEETEILQPGAMLKDGSVLATGTVLRVTVSVSDQVDHPLDLIIGMNNFGKMALKADGLKLANSVLKAEDAYLTGQDSISVPFEITVPSKDVGKSTFEFRFIIQATDTIGNMKQVTSNEKFGFDANPDVEYFDANSVQITSGQLAINASPVEQLVAKAKAIDVGGITSVEWVADAVDGVTFIVKDIDGNVLANNKLEGLTNSQRVDLDLFALVPVGPIGAESFNAHAVVTDNEGNINELNVIQVSINQPPIIAASLPFSATNDLVINDTGEILETLGVGYNAAFADIREVTIEEGTVVNVKIAATDANAADTVAVSATGTARTSQNIIEGVPVISAGMLDFTFNPGYLAVTGEAESATFALDVKATDGSTVAPDTMSLVFNVLAKSATPIVQIVSQKVNGQDVPDVFPKLNEGSTIEIVMTAQDPGNEELVYSLVPDPVEAPATTDTSIAEDGIIWATFTYTAGLQDADVPTLGYDSPIDPLIASFKVANASFSNEINVPIEILNVSQAPVVSATATVNADPSVAVVDGAKIAVDAGATVMIEFNAADPDGDSILTTVPAPTVTPDVYSNQYVTTAYSGPALTTLLTVTVPADVTPENGTATVVYTTSDNTLKERTMTLYIVVDTGPAPVGPSDIDNVLVAQGFGGTNTVNWKNIDPDVTEIEGVLDNDGNPRQLALTSTYRSVAVAANAFLVNIGGGADREAYLDLGDIDGDGDLDIALSMGHVTELGSTFPNIVVVKDAKTKKLIGNSFVAFKTGSDAINYNNGDIPIAVGNFIGSASGDQIACAQGFGGSNIIRIYQYTGLPAPNGFQVVAQFNGLSALALTNNANGGVTLAAGDLDGNGRDELIVGQTNSETSRTQFASIAFTETGAVDYRAVGVAFAGKRQFQGNGGINTTVVDLDGDGTNELVFASAGNTKDFTVDVGRNNAALNVISIIKPVVADGKVTGFTLANAGIVKIFDDNISQTGALSIAAVEGNGLADGKELIFGTKPVLDIDSDTATITARVKADRAKYSFVKAGYDASTNTFTGFTQFLGTQGNGFDAFPLDIDPAGAGVNVAAGQTD